MPQVHNPDVLHIRLLHMGTWTELAWWKNHVLLLREMAHGDCNNKCQNGRLCTGCVTRWLPPMVKVEGISVGYLKTMAHPWGFEPQTSAFGGQRSIQLSYGCLINLFRYLRQFLRARFTRFDLPVNTRQCPDVCHLCANVWQDVSKIIGRQIIHLSLPSAKNRCRDYIVSF